jgi:hypothetical protein
LGAHLAFNLAGWFGTAIVGTLHTFFPSLTQTRLARPRLQGPTYGLWLAGVFALAAGFAFGVPAVSDLGWVSLASAAGLMAANVVGCLRAGPPPVALPARLIAIAHACLVAGLGVALIVSLVQGAAAPFIGRPRAVISTLLLAGWIGLTVAGSLLHLLAILGRIRSFARPLPAPTPGRDRAVSVLAACAVGGLSLARVTGAAQLTVAAVGLTLALTALLAARILALAAGALLRTAS